MSAAPTSSSAAAVLDAARPPAERVEALLKVCGLKAEPGSVRPLGGGGDDDAPQGFLGLHWAANVTSSSSSSSSSASAASPSSKQAEAVVVKLSPAAESQAAEVAGLCASFGREGSFYKHTVPRLGLAAAAAAAGAGSVPVSGGVVPRCLGAVWSAEGDRGGLVLQDGCQQRREKIEGEEEAAAAVAAAATAAAAASGKQTSSFAPGLCRGLTVVEACAALRALGRAQQLNRAAEQRQASSSLPSSSSQSTGSSGRFPVLVADAAQAVSDGRSPREVVQAGTDLLLSLLDDGWASFVDLVRPCVPDGSPAAALLTPETKERLREACCSAEVVDKALSESARMADCVGFVHGDLWCANVLLQGASEEPGEAEPEGLLLIDWQFFAPEGNALEDVAVLALTSVDDAETHLARMVAAFCETWAPRTKEDKDGKKCDKDTAAKVIMATPAWRSALWHALLTVVLSCETWNAVLGDDEADPGRTRVLRRFVTALTLAASE